MRKYPERPIVGVGAVILDGDRVLIIRRGHEPLKGEWSLPGGAVDAGETLVAAVVREAREETGLEVDVGPLVDVVDRIHHDSAGAVEYHYVVADYLCRAIGGTLACGSDADAARWVRVGDLAEFRLSATALAVIRKAASAAWPPQEVHGHSQ